MSRSLALFDIATYSQYHYKGSGFTAAFREL